MLLLEYIIVVGSYHCAAVYLEICAIPLSVWLLGRTGRGATGHRQFWALNPVLQKSPTKSHKKKPYKKNNGNVTNMRRFHKKPRSHTFLQILNSKEKMFLSAGCVLTCESRNNSNAQQRMRGQSSLPLPPPPPSPKRNRPTRLRKEEGVTNQREKITAKEGRRRRISRANGSSVSQNICFVYNV